MSDRLCRYRLPVLLISADPGAVCLTVFCVLSGGRQDLTGTMRMVCEIITAEPAGGSAAIPYNTFERIYKYLATADGSVSSHRPRK